MLICPPTEFLPCQRASADELAHQVVLIESNELFTRLLDAMTGLCMVLNRQRQIVFVNKALMELAKMRRVDISLGRRPGELLDCATAAVAPGGCGTSRDCRQCGVARALAAALEGRAAAGELSLRTRLPGNDLELALRASPFRLGDQDFLVVSAVDIGGFKRREALERIFFHDIMNTAGGIHGWAVEMTVSDPVVAVREYAPIVCDGAERLIAEIRAQQDIVSAERGELPVVPSALSSQEVIAGVLALYGGHEAAKGKTLILAPAHHNVAFSSDRILLSRVLGNLVKNALEATLAGGEVLIWSREEDGKVVFRIQNSAIMPPSVQSQVFHRTFSTKGPGRGLGTYGVRLLTERYLAGSVSFRSSPEVGTVFEAAFPLALQREATSETAGRETSNQTSS